MDSRQPGLVDGRDIRSCGEAGAGGDGVSLDRAGTDVRQRFNELGHEIAPREQQTPEALAAYHKAEIDKWWPIIKAANIKLE